MFIRVPSQVWAMVSTGRVSEFRCGTGNVPQSSWRTPLPTLAIAYRRRPHAFDYRLMFLEDIRREALGAITTDGLAAAGYEGENAFGRFRRDWMLHEKKRFEPLRAVFVYTVRPIRGGGDLADAGAALIDHLYGEYAQEAHTGPRSIQAERRATETARRHRAAVAG